MFSIDKAFSESEKIKAGKKSALSTWAPQGLTDANTLKEDLKKLFELSD